MAVKANLAAYRRYAKFLGARYALVKFLSDFFRKFHFARLSVRLNDRLISGVQAFLKTRYLDTLRQAEAECGRGSPSSLPGEYDGAIWVCWFQGMENAPEIVRKCYAALRRNARGRKIVLITERNMFDFAELPASVIQKYKAGCFAKTHLSDMLRVSLICKYGGVWIDATVFTTRGLDEAVFNSEFYTIRKKPGSPYYIPQGKWTAYFIAGKKGCAVARMAGAVLAAYWKDFDEQIEYFLIDEVIKFCYENSETARRQIDGVPPNNDDCDFFKGRYDEPYDSREWERVSAGTGLFKLSWKVPVDYGAEGTWYSEVIAKS